MLTELHSSCPNFLKDYFNKSVELHEGHFELMHLKKKNQTPGNLEVLLMIMNHILTALL